jgi:WbqC-like protein family
LVRVVISQPMYFPWVGLIEQFKIADIFVFYDDVQFVKGSLFNRVQVKTPSGTRWLTVPLSNRKLSKQIFEIGIDERQDWRVSQRSLLRQANAGAAHLSDMIDLLDSVFARSYSNVAELSIDSMLALASYFGILAGKKVLRSSGLNIGGSGSQRVYDICKSLAATSYVTGHGAANYLDHGMFDKAGIEVGYMKYEKTPYPQLHGEFTPFVTALDLVANCGRAGASCIGSSAIHWRDFFRIYGQSPKS